MRRLLLVLAAWALAFSPGVASAQGLLLFGVGAARGSGGGGGYAGPGDLVASAKAWYGFRAYNAAAAASQLAAVRLKRSSDGELCDIKVATSGDLSTLTSNCSGSSTGATATTWCAASSGSCSVDTWYDQSGGGFNATKSGSSNPTFVFSCVNAKPCMTTDGSTQYLLATGSTSTAQQVTISAVAIRTANSAGQGDILGDSNGCWFNPGGGVGCYYGASGTALATESVWHALQFVANGSSSAINVDGSDTTGLGMGTNALDNGFAIARQSSGNFLTGKISEAAVWASGFNSTQRGSVCHNQAAYFGITATC